MWAKYWKPSLTIVLRVVENVYLAYCGGYTLRPNVIVQSALNSEVYTTSALQQRGIKALYIQLNSVSFVFTMDRMYMYVVPSCLK